MMVIGTPGDEGGERGEGTTLIIMGLVVIAASIAVLVPVPRRRLKTIAFRPAVTGKTGDHRNTHKRPDAIVIRGKN